MTSKRILDRWLRTAVAVVALAVGAVLLGASIREYRSESWAERASEHRRWGRLEAADAALLTAIDIAPADALLHAERARLLASFATFRDAESAAEDSVRAFDRAIELRPFDPNLHADMAAALASFGMPDSARAALTRAIELDPHNAHYHARMGALWEDLGKYERALAAYQIADSILPTAEIEQRILDLTSPE